MARRTFSLFFVVFAATAAYLPAQNATTAQSVAVTPTTPAMPTDPTKLMHLATQVNGLDAPDMKPWHLVATYQTFDEKGNPKDRGSFEEWWAAPDKFKLSYKSSGFNRVEYRNDRGTFVVGEQKWTPMPELLIAQNLVSPLQSENFGEPFYESEKTVGNVSLRCLRPGSSSVAEKRPFPVYCFTHEIPAIRLTAPYSDISTTFNKIIRFRRRYVAQQIEVTEDGHPLLNIDVNSLDALETINDADLAVPPQASIAGQFWVPAKWMEARKLSGSPPDYPLSARSRHIQGIVVVAATISKDGRVSDLQPVSGPPELQRAVMDAAKTWRYQPYLLNGEAVDVRTQINAMFTVHPN